MSSKPIPINTITPNENDPQSDGYRLRTYCFKAEESGLNMYTPNGQTLVKGNITLGTPFPVQIPGLSSPMNVTVTSYTLQVNGSWSDISPEADPGSGTFQAQAGGQAADDEDAAASATA